MYMNKYLEKLAAVPHLVKARRRAMQLLEQGSHDWKAMDMDATRSVLSQGVIKPGTWGTNGSGVYAGHRAPAHGYQPTGHADRTIAFPTQGAEHVPTYNHRFSGHPTPVQDTVIRREVRVGGKDTYVALPKQKDLVSGHLRQDMEDSIRHSKVRRIYDEDIKDILAKKNLYHEGWDPVTAGKEKWKDTGHEYRQVLTEKLEGKVPQEDLLHAFNNPTTREGRISLDAYKNSSPIKQKRMESLKGYLGTQELISSGDYRKHLKD